MKTAHTLRDLFDGHTTRPRQRPLLIGFEVAWYSLLCYNTVIPE